MKKRLFGIIVLGAVVLLAACGKQTKEDIAEGATAEKKVTLLLVLLAVMRKYGSLLRHPIWRKQPIWSLRLK